MNGFIITCSSQALQLGADRILYILVHDPITVFPYRKQARNAIRRTIYRRIKDGYHDEFSVASCYKIHMMIDSRAIEKSEYCDFVTYINGERVVWKPKKRKGK